MSIKVSLSDNSIHSLPVDFIHLSHSFKDDEVNHIHVSILIFNKIKDFGEYYLSLNKKDRKMFEDPGQIWDKDNSIQTWCDEFLKMSHTDVIELMNESHKLNIKPLLDLCCYHISQLIKDKTTDEMRDMFHVVNDFSPEETEKLKKETEWIE